MSHRELPETPEIEEDIVDVFDDFITKKLLDVHTCLPGRILSYEGHETRRAQVEISVHMPSNNGEFVKANPIGNVPVIFPSSSTTNILFPLMPGDGCLLLFSEAGIGNFLNGEVTVNADDFSRFDTTDCICMPGLWSTPTLPVPEVEINEEAFQIIHGKNNIELSPTGIVISREDSKIEILDGGDINVTGANLNVTGEDINVTGADITVGGDNIAVDGTAIALNGDAKPFVTHAELDIALQTFVTALNTHVHLGNLAAPTGPVVPPQVINIAAAATQTVKTGG